MAKRLLLVNTERRVWILTVGPCLVCLVGFLLRLLFPKDVQIRLIGDKRVCVCVFTFPANQTEKKKKERKYVMMRVSWGSDPWGNVRSTVTLMRHCGSGGIARWCHHGGQSLETCHTWQRVYLCSLTSMRSAGSEHVAPVTGPKKRRTQSQRKADVKSVRASSTRCRI